MSSRPVLEVRDLRKRFGGLVAVNGMSFDLHAGEILGLIGPNGSGKSTAMKLIMGVERPSGGTIRLNGANPNSFALNACNHNASGGLSTVIRPFGSAATKKKLCHERSIDFTAAE